MHKRFVQYQKNRYFPYIILLDQQQNNQEPPPTKVSTRLPLSVEFLDCMLAMYLKQLVSSKYQMRMMVVESLSDSFRVQKRGLFD